MSTSGMVRTEIFTSTLNLGVLCPASLRLKVRLYRSFSHYIERLTTLWLVTCRPAALIRLIGSELATRADGSAWPWLQRRFSRSVPFFPSSYALCLLFTLLGHEHRSIQPCFFRHATGSCQPPCLPACLADHPATNSKETETAGQREVVGPWAA